MSSLEVTPAKVPSRGKSSNSKAAAQTRKIFAGSRARHLFRGPGNRSHFKSRIFAEQNRHWIIQCNDLNSTDQFQIEVELKRHKTFRFDVALTKLFGVLITLSTLTALTGCKSESLRVGVSAKKTPHTSVSGIRWISFDAREMAESSRLAKWRPLWDPAPGQISAALDRLPELFLAHSDYSAWLPERQKLQRTACQAVGEIV